MSAKRPPAPGKYRRMEDILNRLRFLAAVAGELPDLSGGESCGFMFLLTDIVDMIEQTDNQETP